MERINWEAADFDELSNRNRFCLNTQMKLKAMSAHKWQFTPRFRRNAFGWRSDTPIQRIKEALTEIRLVARKEPVLAAEGATVLLEKLSPALMNVDRTHIL